MCVLIAKQVPLRFVLIRRNTMDFYVCRNVNSFWHQLFITYQPAERNENCCRIIAKKKRHMPEFTQ